jgi:hypothetical protein
MIGMVVVAFFDGKRCGRCDHYDDVNVQSNHLRRKLLESLRAALCISAIDNDVSASGHAAAPPSSVMNWRRRMKVVI